MSETSPIEGSKSPEDNSTKKKGAEPHPDKFKELLKTDESEESKKRKRQMKEELEEEFDEELSEEQLQEKASIFNSFMSDTSQNSSSLYDTKEANRQDRTRSDSSQDTYDQMYFSKKSDEKRDQKDEAVPISSTTASKSSKQKNTTPKKLESRAYKRAKTLQEKKLEKEDAVITKKPSILKGSTQPDIHSKEPVPKSQIEKEPIIKKPVAKKIKQDLHEPKQKSPSLLFSEKKQVLKDETLQSKAHEKQSKPIQTSKPQEIEQPIQSQIEQQTIAQQGLTTAAKQAGTQKESAIGAVQGLSPTAKDNLSSSLKARNMPIYSTFSKPQFALFQKLVGLVTIQTLKGVQKTEITLSMKNSIFNGLVVRLDHYDTNPHTFNINLYCSPQAQEALIANLPNLQQAFDQGNFSFKANILSPSLLKDKKIKKVEKSSEKDVQ